MTTTSYPTKPITPAWRTTNIVMASICAVWVLWFGYLTITKFRYTGFGAFDLGIFDQGVWLLSEFKEPFITLRGLHLFADHASYILILLAPLYWIKATPIILIAICVLAPAVAAWLSYVIARTEGVGSRAAVLVGLAVLAHPAMAWTPWDAFHPETVAIVLFPASYLLARRGRFGWALLLAALILLVKEDSGLLVAPYALFWWFRWKEARKHAYVLAALAVVVQALSLLVVLPGFSPTGELIYTGRYSLDILDLVTWPRAVYLIAMLLPAILTLWAPKVLVLAVPITIANMASGHGYQHEIMWHYTAYALGVFAVAVPVGASRFIAMMERRYESRYRFGEDGVLAMVPPLILALGGLFIAGPDLSTRWGVWGGLSPSETVELETALAAIPDEAVVSATFNLTTHLAHRVEIYMAPNPWRNRYWGAQDLPPLPDPNRVEYLAVDTRKKIDDMDVTVAELLDAGWVVEVPGTFLLLRNPNPG